MTSARRPWTLYYPSSSRRQCAMQASALSAETPQTSLSLTNLDKKASLQLHRSVGSKLPRSAYILLEHSGNGILWLLAVPILWHFEKHPGRRTTLANCFLGLWIDIALVGSLKWITRRPRPEYNLSSDFVLVVAVDKFSFPSGHAARVAYIAAFAMCCTSQVGFVSACCLNIWALTTATSRALMGRHYIGDVAAGLLTGLMTTAMVTKGTFSGTVGWINTPQSEAIREQLQEILQAYI